LDLVNASQSVCTEDFKHLQWFKDKILRLEVPYTALRFTLEMWRDHSAMVSLPSCLRCFESIAEENSARRKGQPG
jgi:hypothetical protein